MSQNDDDEGWVDDAPPVEAEFLGGPTEPPPTPLEEAVKNAVEADDREALARAIKEAEAQDREIALGSYFKQERWSEDPRFDVVTFRVPNGRFHSADAPLHEPMEYHGDRARWRMIRFMCATLAGVGEMIGAPPAFALLCKLIYKESKVREIGAEQEVH